MINELIEEGKKTRDSRKKLTGEFFTPDDLTDHMLNLFESSAWEENKTFLEPSAR